MINRTGAKRQQRDLALTLETQIVRIRRRFIASIITGFLLTVLAGHSLAILFRLLTPEQLLHTTYLVYLAFLILGFSAFSYRYYRRVFAPVFAWISSHPGNNAMPEQLHRPLHRFAINYWEFYLAYVLTVPLLFSLVTDNIDPVLQLNLHVQQLVAAVLMALPAFLYAMDVMGRITAHSGLPRVQFGLRIRLMLLGGFVPLLTHAVVLKYYWNRTEFLNAETIVVLAVVGLIIIAITLLSIKNMGQSLGPVQRMLTAKGATSYTDMAGLRPLSTDEIGYLTQTLGSLFNKLSAQESYKRAIVDTAAEAIIAITDTLQIKSVNPAAEKLFGYNAQDLVGKPLSLILPGITSANTIDNHLHREKELDGLTRKGINIPLSLRFGEMNLAGNRLFTCIAADISARKAAQREQMKAEARYRDLVETAHDLVWTLDLEGRWKYLNNACNDIYGLTPDKMLGKSLTDFSVDEFLERDTSAFLNILNGEELVFYETTHRDNAGNLHTLSFNARPIYDEDGNIIQISGTARDITKQKLFESQLAYQAQHDSLTGLYNRSYFDEELERTISRVVRSDASCAVFYIDLDQFKYINDTLGHAAGDRLLIEVGNILERNKRDGDLLARFGGDEFTLLLYNVLHPDNALRAAENLRKNFENFKFYEDGKAFNITCSIGVAMIDHSSTDKNQVLSHADLACNISKTMGRNRVHIYSPADDAHITMAEDMGWAARVRDVLEKDRFQLYYQPILSLSDGTIHDYEVLLRMPVENGDIILPGGFMPAAERFGLIQSIDRWTVQQAIRQLSALRGNGYDINFNINLSGQAFEDKELLPLIWQTLDTVNLDSSHITFEITETAAITNLNVAISFIQQLKKTGCHFALDDFGSGFCSFGYLKNLPVDKLKIDGSFIKGLAGAPVDQAMVQSMNQVAHALNKKTIAESVEDGETLALLEHFGIDFAQGNYIGEPGDFIESSQLQLITP
jgi:diguanylate cyclase (GGDEF)-like protein/PAS domain S-box-containing protein